MNKAEAEDTNMISLIESLSNGIVMFDKNKVVTLANNTVTRFTGLPKEGYDLNELARLFSGIKLMNYVDDAILNGKIIQVPRSNLATFYYEMTIVPVRNAENSVIGGAIVLHDITHIVEVDKTKSEFVSLASHQLRTPLGTTRWYAEMLADGDYGELTEDQKIAIETIHTSTMRLIELVNSLLNVSRLELGTFAVDPENMNLIELINEVVLDLKVESDKKSQKVLINLDLAIQNYFGDKNLLRIIVRNLLTNAIKYTPENGEISIALKSEDDANYLLSFKDNGYGIPAGQKDKIFTKLFRADNIKTKDTEGTGLGLYIVKEILQTAGGSIDFDSIENEGTTFYIRLPKIGMKAKTGSKPLIPQKV